jgi:hypothetical protein
MALSDTGKAIGAVTDALRDRLDNRSKIHVTVGRPEKDQGSTRLNLFLYEVMFDPNLKNEPLDEGQPPPLWIVLKYLMTAFDDAKESDSIQAYEYLGRGMRALQSLNFLSTVSIANPDYLKALAANPEELKITFDDSPTELLSKVMQGSDDQKYRLSVAFQVRPVMIATGEPAAYSLLVGVDYTTPPTPPTTIGAKGIVIPVLPSLGPSITRIEPESFEAGDTVTIYGTDLHLSDLSVRLGPVELPVVMQQPDRLKVRVQEELVRGDLISAGGHPVTVVQAVTSTRRRVSNLLVGNLLPTVASAAVLSTAPGLDPGTVAATIELGGLLLGGDNDDDFLALYRDGVTYKVLDAFMKEADIPGPPPPPAVPAQTRKRIAMQPADGVPPGGYLAILRVNGVQAKQSLSVVLS